MSPTLLEVTIGLIAAVLVFLFALRAVPMVIYYLSRYFDTSLGVDETDAKEVQHHDR